MIKLSSICFTRLVELTTSSSVMLQNRMSSINMKLEHQTTQKCILASFRKLFVLQQLTMWMAGEKRRIEHAYQYTLRCSIRSPVSS